MIGPLLPPERGRWARALLEAGGNIGSATLSNFAGTMASVATRNLTDDAANYLVGKRTQSGTIQTNAHDSVMNLLSNTIASAAGAVGGLIAGPGHATANGLNGAAAASAIQQYNQAFTAQERKGVEESRKKTRKVLEVTAYFPLIGGVSNLGLAKDANINMMVTGKEICSYCQSDIPKMADRIGLNSMDIKNDFDQYIWEKGMKNFNDYHNRR